MTRNLNAVANMGSQSPLRAADEDAAWMSPDYDERLVSVIVPTFNRAELIEETLDSVWRQTYRPIELLIVDDGSTDNTAAVIDAWSQAHAHDPQFHTLYFPRANAGAPAARNFGLKASRGEFIQFLDSDDLLHPEKFKAQIDPLIANPELMFTSSDYVAFDGTLDWTKNLTARFPRKKSSTPLQAWLSYQITAETLVYRRQLCVKAGPWNEGMKILQDWHYNLKCLLQSEDAIHVPRVLSAWRHHPGPRVSGHQSQKLDATVQSILNIENLFRGSPEWGPGPAAVMASNWRTLLLRAAKAGRTDQVAVIADRLRALSDRNMDRLASAMMAGISSSPAWLRPLPCLAIQWVYRAARAFLGRVAEARLRFNRAAQAQA